MSETFRIRLTKGAPWAPVKLARWCKCTPGGGEWHIWDDVPPGPSKCDGIPARSARCLDGEPTQSWCEHGIHMKMDGRVCWRIPRLEYLYLMALHAPRPTVKRDE